MKPGLTRAALLFTWLKCVRYRCISALQPDDGEKLQVPVALYPSKDDPADVVSVEELLQCWGEEAHL